MTSTHATPGAAFEQLAKPVQRWIYDQGWSALRQAQEAAIPVILEGRRDVLISASTAAGKTEAAFLPILSALLDAPASSPGVRTLMVAPLKALINDQFRRLTDMCAPVGVEVHRWHGDVTAGSKHKVLKDPGGILLITPESLEALFVLHGPQIPALFGQLRYVVIDELHAFLGTERGAQLRSLLHRLDLAARRRIVRIGLSATLGDLHLAAEQLRPGGADRVEILRIADGGLDVQVAVRSYVDRAAVPAPRTGDVYLDKSKPIAPGSGAAHVAAHLYGVMRGSDNLVFANSRSDVESFADRLRVLSETAHVPNEFFPHHGNLSKALREDVEAALKDPNKPATAVATTTLEMGIDIGSVRSVGQLGAPPGVASVRQRVGRSGRRGSPPILRVYLTEPEVEAQSPLADELHEELIQTIAILELFLVDGWCEPPDPAVLHTSTLVQQLLSLIAQHGGVSAAQAHSLLCTSDGPFGGTDRARFAAVLRSLAAARVIEQASDGTLLLGAVGERTVAHYSFFASFQTGAEYRLVADGKPLGTVPIESPLY